jgi:hypothetical protein
MANASLRKYRSPFKTFKPFNRCAPFQSLTDRGSFKVQAFKVQRQLALVQVVQNVQSLRSIQNIRGIKQTTGKLPRFGKSRNFEATDGGAAR